MPLAVRDEGAVARNELGGLGRAADRNKRRWGYVMGQAKPRAFDSPVPAFHYPLCLETIMYTLRSHRARPLNSTRISALAGRVLERWRRKHNGLGVLRIKARRPAVGPLR
jgi:hypothetical protein